MRKNYLWIAALATTMMTSCIYDNENDLLTAQQGQYSNEEILITAAMQEPAGETRAASTLQGASITWTNAGIYVYKTTQTSVSGNYGFENQQVTGSSSYSSGGVTGDKLTIGSSLLFPYDNGDVDVYVYAPHTNVTTGLTTTTGVTATSVSNMAIQVQDDQTETNDYIKSDFIYGMAKAYYDNSPTDYVDKVAQVTMYHALTKLTFKLQDGSNTTPSLGTDASGITEIKLTNVYKKATIDMTEPVTATSAPWLTAGTHVTTADGTGDPKGDVIVAQFTGTTGDHTTNFYSTAKTDGVSAIIPPCTSTQLTAADPGISVTIDGGTKTAKIKGTDITELVPGYEYVFNLKISGTELIIVAVSIKPWETQTAVDRTLDF